MLNLLCSPFQIYLSKGHLQKRIVKVIFLKLIYGLTLIM